MCHQHAQHIHLLKKCMFQNPQQKYLLECHAVNKKACVQSTYSSNMEERKSSESRVTLNQKLPSTQKTSRNTKSLHVEYKKQSKLLYAVKQRHVWYHTKGDKREQFRTKWTNGKFYVQEKKKQTVFIWCSINVKKPPRIKTDCKLGKKILQQNLQTIPKLESCILQETVKTGFILENSQVELQIKDNLVKDVFIPGKQGKAETTQASFPVPGLQKVSFEHVTSLMTLGEISRFSSYPFTLSKDAIPCTISSAAVKSFDHVFSTSVQLPPVYRVCLKEMDMNPCLNAGVNHQTGMLALQSDEKDLHAEIKSTLDIQFSYKVDYSNRMRAKIFPDVLAAFLGHPDKILAKHFPCFNSREFGISLSLSKVQFLSKTDIELEDFLVTSVPSWDTGLCNEVKLFESEEIKQALSWRMSKGMTIMVTGGAGYIGSHSVIELVEAGYDIVVIDNLVNASMESIRRVEKIVGKQIPSYSVDLLNKEALDEVFKKHKISAVIHFAGLKAVGESCELPLLYYKTNVGGTTNLLEVMEANGVYDLVFSSSATVYGTPQFLPLTENHPVGGCTNPYGKTKFMIEQILQDISSANKKWNIVILRYFNPVGSHKSGTIGEDPQGVPNNLMPYIAQVAVGRREFLSIYGGDYDTPDGTGVRDYIHVVDLAQGHVAAIKKLEEKCGLKIYNLGTGQGYSVLDMAKAFEKASGKKIPYKVVERRAGDIGSCYSDTSLAAKELGWTAKKGLDEMCEDLWRWQSQNPQGYNTVSN